MAENNLEIAVQRIATAVEYFLTGQASRGGGSSIAGGHSASDDLHAIAAALQGIDEKLGVIVKLQKDDVTRRTAGR